MRITIVRDDSVVGVDGIFRRINLSAMPAGIRAVQWNGVNGHIEYDDASNTPLQSIADFQQFIDAWRAAAPQPAAPAALSEPKTTALNRINNAYQAAIAAMTAGYPKDEIESWPKQEAEARAWLSDPGILTPWMDGAASGRGISKPQLAAKIMDRVNRFATEHGRLTGKRQKLRDQITALGEGYSQEQLDAIQW
jgi:hypothetical protein